jgi:hypothetical protein
VLVRSGSQAVDFIHRADDAAEQSTEEFRWRTPLR